MATGETGFKDITFDLISVQYHSLKAGHDYGQYVRDAENAGQNEMADFFKEIMRQDSERAEKCHQFLQQLSRSGEAGPSAS
jgi:rubrerythrin